MSLTNYFSLIAQLDEGTAAPLPEPTDSSTSQTTSTAQAANIDKRQRINVDVLKRTWDAGELASKEVTVKLISQ